MLSTRLRFGKLLRSSVTRTLASSFEPRESKGISEQIRGRRISLSNILRIFEQLGDPGVEAWFALAVDGDYELAKNRAEDALARDPSSRFAHSALAEIAVFSSRFDIAAQHIQKAIFYNPHNKWLRLTLADIYVEGKELEKAISLLEESQDIPGLERHVYKRLARLYYRIGNLPASLFWQEKLVGLAPDYLVYASDYLLLAWLQLRVIADADQALDTLKAAAQIYKRNPRIKEAILCLEKSTALETQDRALYFGEDTAKSFLPQLSSTQALKVEGFPKVSCIPVHTPLVTMHTDIISLIDAATGTTREADDTVAISESVLAIAQGRAIPLELVDPGPISRFLCKFVGKEGPLHSPEGMQGAVFEAGAVKIVVAATAGGLARLSGRKGVFYKIAGPRCAMIDDVAACMPPFDHHLILGPSNPDKFAEIAAATLGCRVCVVDANNKTGAWVVGASKGVNRTSLEKVLRHNPAGNEDEQTPVVLIKGFK